MPRRLQAATAGDRLPPHMGAAAAVAHGSILSLVLYLPALGNRDGSISVLYSKPGILFGVWACGCPGCKGLTAPVFGGAGNGDMSEAPAVPDAGVRFRRGVLGLILWGTRTPVSRTIQTLKPRRCRDSSRRAFLQKPKAKLHAQSRPRASSLRFANGGGGRNHIRKPVPEFETRALGTALATPRADPPKPETRTYPSGRGREARMRAGGGGRGGDIARALCCG